MRWLGNLKLKSRINTGIKREKIAACHCENFRTDCASLFGRALGVLGFLIALSKIGSRDDVPWLGLFGRDSSESRSFQ